MENTNKQTENILASGIYAIYHIDSGKRYVGSAVNIRTRWATHKTSLNKGYHENGHLQRAWNKYGPESFRFVVIERCPVEQLIEREQRHIDERADFNILPVAGSRLGQKHTIEACEKIRKARIGKKLSAEQCAKISARGKGRILSPETRAKISERQQGEKNHRFGKYHTEEHKAMLRAATSGEKSRTFGRKHTEDEKTKMKEAWKNRIVPEEIKDRLRTVMIGKQHSDETKAKMSARRADYWARKKGGLLCQAQ